MAPTSILDIMGAAYLARNVDALAADGRIANIGLQGGAKGRARHEQADAASAGPSCPPRCGRAPRSRKEAIVQAVREHVWPLIDAGKIRPVIYRELPFSEVAEAHRIMEAGTHTGKILLRTQ